ncbi:hypothetical protein [Bradyrhizobium liaoningense]|uniref:hypothetical protein n=1 Tax=Bradyrhizobium liaoningense TaxID=43992 RepID=UPI001BAC10F5|nr:hypothetical protein [Bradyrhizobium liaoningense]MBR0903009.1 hypothetical protein [Bradyrhizobium liaoningense]
MSDVELVAREQRRETPTTIRQYVSFEWRGQNASAKKSASIAVERKAMEYVLLKRCVALKSRSVCQVDVRHCLEHRHRKKATGV